MPGLRCCPCKPGVFAMGPKPPTTSDNADLFRSRLENLLDHQHPLYRLAGLIDWSQFDRAFGRFYRPLGRPAKPTRLMVGLSYLKHVYDLSDEAVCERWRENPYWQFFCGCVHFQHDLPCDPSSLTRWRRRIGPEGMTMLLAATEHAGLQSGTVKPSSLERVIIDTTVQPKAIAHPTDVSSTSNPSALWCVRRSGTAPFCVRPTRA